MADQTRLSKFLSLILRHRAQDFGLTLDADGFTDLDSVWAAVERCYPGCYIEADLQAVVAGDPTGKKRFEIVGDRIRARYGHTQVRTITYPPVEPPEYLYHGTHAKALDAIRGDGLKPMQRQYVHLSLSVEWAVMVGRRRTDAPVILRVRAGEAHRAGIEFYHPEPNHYLVEAVPPRFIDFDY
ncbi:MAG: RNA 2'-phosphotransferase [Anaerolineae bacterium]|nr:RNA 2'-phosphotransferase [Anaerolineae bacterium]